MKRRSTEPLKTLSLLLPPTSAPLGSTMVSPVTLVLSEMPLKELPEQLSSPVTELSTPPSVCLIPHRKRGWHQNPHRAPRKSDSLDSSGPLTSILTAFM